METVSIRSGVTSGDVILMEGDDYIGHCVNVASRLCDLAQGGEALAAPSVVDDLPRWGVVLARRDIVLRGVAHPIPTSSIGMASLGDGRSRDPICGLPLSAATAEAVADDAHGAAVLFCSTGCLDTWHRRPQSPNGTRGEGGGGGDGGDAGPPG
ncbi:MAG: hypothetical protein ACLPVF_00640 [Acidimicrobiales bacterium]